MAVINCDVDGVVFDFVPSLFNSLRAEGYDIEDVSDPKWDTWNFFDQMEEDARDRAFDILKEPIIWASGSVVPGAIESINALRDAGHHIQWVTTAWLPCFGWADYRRAWLDANFNHADQDLSKDLTVTGDKSRIYADVFIDDKFTAVSSWAEHHRSMPGQGLALMYRTYFNRSNQAGLSDQVFENTDDPNVQSMVWDHNNLQALLKHLEGR